MTDFMRRNRWTVIVLAVVALAFVTQASANRFVQSVAVGVPSIYPDYDVDVETWWAGHRFNPESASYDPVINSPEPVLDVAADYGGSIQSALDALPSDGGTLYLAAGTYQIPREIFGQSHVHFIGADGAIVTGNFTIDIMRCDRSGSYTNPDCFLNPVQDFYFKNITFDGSNSAVYAFLFRAARDIVFDNCTFQNFVDSASYNGHGLVMSAARVDNIWFRNCDFVGTNDWGLSLDGTHGSGVIDSRFGANFWQGGIVLLTNDDLTRDTDGDGVLDPNEERISRYVIVQGNTFGGDANMALSVNTADTLVRDNVAEGYVNTFINLNGKRSVTNPDHVYHFYNNLMIGNRTANLVKFAVVNIYGCTAGATNCSRGGRYTITENVIDAPAFQYLVLESSDNIDGPNVVENNCINDPGCTVDPATPTPEPPATDTPTAATDTPAPATETPEPPTATPTAGCPALPTGTPWPTVCICIPGEVKP